MSSFIIKELRYHFQNDIGKISSGIKMLIPVACTINSITIVIYDCGDNGLFISMFTIIIIIIMIYIFTKNLLQVSIDKVLSGINMVIPLA